MVFEKTAYWMAVGVLALVVSNNLAVRHGLNAGSLPNRAIAAVERVAGDATRLLGTAEVMLGQAGIAFRSFSDHAGLLPESAGFRSKQDRAT